MKKKTLVSGIQPTGNLHIGNYLGAVKQWVELQEGGEYNMFIFIADLHSLTGSQSPKERHDQIFRTAAELVAAGIDPEKTTLWVQSHVPACTELSWIFQTLTPLGELDRMTQFKDKSEGKKSIDTGLFTYPILQAADILLYKGSAVPVGEDQKQHVELTRAIAKKFNSAYKKFFPEPKALLTKTPRVKSLLEPTKKMSKSAGPGHVIELADEPSVLEKKIKKAVTATEGGGEAPGVKNLLLLLDQFGQQDIHKAFVKAEKDGSIRYGDLKKEVASAIGDHFESFRARRRELLDNHDEIGAILIDGARKAEEVAQETMEQVRSMIGVR